MHGGPYAGQDRFEARANLWGDMKSAGLVLKEEDYTLNVPRSQRGGEIIEPMVSTQWFVRMNSLAEAALQAVRDGRIRIVPDHFTRVYYNWLENIQDWCISRQLWWGHRIPVWYCSDCSEMIVARQDPDSCPACGSDQLEQDPDVLDTWFSSGLWPFSTLGWPDETPDFKYFYPTSYMETGYDILFFWVARMIMSGLEYTGEIPFHTVYLHGLIRDESGRKMSKSYGNVIDPLVVMDELGTDALRFTLLVGSTPGKDTNLSIKKVEANRNFANKMWNAGRFITGALPQAPADAAGAPEWTLADGWIWARLKILTRDVERLFQNFQYGEAGRQIYEFFWSDFADWYLEIAKLQLAQDGDRAFYTADLMTRVYDIVLRMLHPYTPFVTEELWGYLKGACMGHSDRLIPQDGSWAEALIVARWPEGIEDEGWEQETIKRFQQIQEIVRQIRNLRAERSISPSRRLAAMITCSRETLHTLQGEAGTIAALARLDADKVTIIDIEDGQFQRPPGHIALVSGSSTIYLPLAELVDVQEERGRLEKELQEVEEQINRLENMLAGPFAEKAPEAVVQKERSRLADYLETAEKINTQLEDLGT